MYADLGTPRLSFRRLRVVLEHSALDSEYARKKLGDKARWSTTEHLIATVADLIQIGNWQYATAHSKKGHAPPKPTPIERPGQASKRRQNRTQLSEREIARRLVEMQRRQNRKG